MNDMLVKINAWLKGHNTKFDAEEAIGALVVLAALVIIIAAS